MRRPSPLVRPPHRSIEYENKALARLRVDFSANLNLALQLPSGLLYGVGACQETRRTMLPTVEILLRRSITLDHPSWTWEQIVLAAREALQGRGDYAFLAADLRAAQSA